MCACLHTFYLYVSAFHLKFIFKWTSALLLNDCSVPAGGSLPLRGGLPEGQGDA